MTFFVAQGLVQIPGGTWFSEMLAARRELDAMDPEGDDRYDSVRGCELGEMLEQMDGVSLHDLEGMQIGDVGLTFLHYNDETRMLTLAVIVDSYSPGPHTGPQKATDLDRLFEGQYDPTKLQLTDEDTPYVIVRFDQHGQLINPVTVIQPVDEDVPAGVCAPMPTPHEFIGKLAKLVP